MSIFTPEFDSERQKTRQSAREHPPKPITAQRGSRLRYRLSKTRLIVEVSQTSIRPGQAVRIYICQAGPATFDPYALSVVCYEILQVYARSDYVRRYDVEDEERYEEVERYRERVNTVFEQKLFEQRLELGKGQNFDRTASWVVPGDAEPTGRSELHEFRWVIRVEGARDGDTVLALEFPFNVLAT